MHHEVHLAGCCFEKTRITRSHTHTVSLLYRSAAGNDVSVCGSQESASQLEMREAHAMIKDGLLRTITPDQVRMKPTVLSSIAILRTCCSVGAKGCDGIRCNAIHVSRASSRERPTKPGRTRQIVKKRNCSVATSFQRWPRTRLSSRACGRLPRHFLRRF